MARRAASDSDKKDGFSRREREIMDALDGTDTWTV